MKILSLKKRVNSDKCVFFREKNSVCLGSLLSMRSFASEDSNSPIPELITCLRGCRLDPDVEPGLGHKAATFPSPLLSLSWPRWPEVTIETHYWRKNRSRWSVTKREIPAATHCLWANLEPSRDTQSTHLWHQHATSEMPFAVAHLAK